MTIDPELLSILACPVCRGALREVGEQEGLLCASCVKVYPIREEIPVMLAEEAVPLADWERGMRSVPAARKA